MGLHFRLTLPSSFLPPRQAWSTPLEFEHPKRKDGRTLHPNPSHLWSPVLEDCQLIWGDSKFLDFGTFSHFHPVAPTVEPRKVLHRASPGRLVFRCRIR